MAGIRRVQTLGRCARTDGSRHQGENGALEAIQQIAELIDRVALRIEEAIALGECVLPTDSDECTQVEHVNTV